REMDYSIITRLDDLPVEIFMEIFDYLTTSEIYFSFSQLNNRLNSIFKSLPHLMLSPENYLDRFVLSFLNSFKAIRSISRHSYPLCSCKSHSINGGNRLFEIYPLWDPLWHPDLSNDLEKIIRPDICLQLRTLVLPATSSKLAQLIFNGEF